MLPTRPILSRSVRALLPLAAILAADIVGYSGLMGIDEEGTLTRLKEWREKIIDPAVQKHKGRVFKSMGDGLLAEFGSAVDAVQCGIEIQNLMSVRKDDALDRQRLKMRRIRRRREGHGVPREHPVDSGGRWYWAHARGRNAS